MYHGKKMTKKAKNMKRNLQKKSISIDFFANQQHILSMFALQRD